MRLGTLAFLCAALVPFLVLLWQAYRQLEMETFFDYRSRAETTYRDIDRELRRIANELEVLSSADFSFFSEDDAAETTVRSALSNWAASPEAPGIDGYFQISERNGFSTPNVPSVERLELSGLNALELRQRQSAADRLLESLTARPKSQPGLDAVEPGLPQEPPAPRRERQEGGRVVVTGALNEVMEDDEDSTNDVDQQLSQYVTDAFRGISRRRGEDEVAAQSNSLGRLDDLNLNDRLKARSDELESRQIENTPSAPGADAASSEAIDSAASAAVAVNVTATGISEDVRDLINAPTAVELRLLQDGKAMLYRRVQLDRERAIQGIVLDLPQLASSIVSSQLSASSIGDVARIVTAVNGDVIALTGGTGAPGTIRDLTGFLLLDTRASSPFNDLQVIISADTLPRGPGSALVGWTALLFAAVLIAGCALLYRTGMRHIALADQQRQFVAAVSHELKTPLTSIRMYGDMLSAGWTEESKRQQYYEFIREESERLTRLIDNVLRLSRITRSGSELKLERVRGAALVDLLQSRIADRVARSGSELAIKSTQEARSTTVLVDSDAFLQIAINLVDNAIKFGATDEQTARVECRVFTDEGSSLLFAVRDYGPGIPQNDVKKVFDLFQRGEQAATRNRSGTGIGLGIVRMLAEDMQATVRVANRNPGAEFTVTFPPAAANTDA